MSQQVEPAMMFSVICTFSIICLFFILVLMLLVVFSNSRQRTVICESCGKEARLILNSGKRYSMCRFCHNTILLSSKREDRDK